MRVEGGHAALDPHSSRPCDARNRSITGHILRTSKGMGWGDSGTAWPFPNLPTYLSSTVYQIGFEPVNRKKGSGTEL
jgi:hypothetical protein